MNIKNSILFRVRLSFILVVLFALAIVYRIGVIQFVEGEKWNALAAQIGLQYREVEATRGNILSDNGSLLATSIPFYRLALDPSRPSDELLNDNLDSLAYYLSNFYGDASATSYKRKIIDARVSGRRYIMLNRSLIDYQEKKMISQWPLLRNGRLKAGVLFEKVDKRFLPFNYLAERTIGFVNENNNGAGLEYSFNSQLAGQPGKALFQKTMGGNWKPMPDASEVRPVDGYDLETTIDINLQDMAESALLNSLISHNADYGTVVVMEVKTGQIKAMSNLGKLKNGNYGEKYNYAVGSHGLREPGSTFKLMTMLALLEETNLNLTDTIDTGDGAYTFYKSTIKDHEKGGYGKITVEEAFEVSSNIAMAKLADKYFSLKPQLFYNSIEKVGLTKPMGFQITGEGKPKVKKPEDWSGITLPWMAHGYGLELTPLHTLSLYNAVANNGVMVKPYIVKSVRKADRVIQEFGPVITNKAIASTATLSKLRILLEGVVESGTAKNISNAQYKIAGKTGTAVTLKNGRYQKAYMTSFVGYFPANNPEYSCIVIIENPKGVWQYGSSVAAPVFKEIADKIFAKDIEMHMALENDYTTEYGVFPVIRSGYKPDLQYLCNDLGISNHSGGDSDWVKTKVDDNSVVWKQNKVAIGVTPDVLGMTLRDALYVLESCGYEVRLKGLGRVKKQSVMPGRKITKGNKITIELG
ncbi:MAG: cell division protein [Bacteroidetes bacterium]|nr:MAG: cell division protein [Bacteroidota bacterium]